MATPNFSAPALSNKISSDIESIRELAKLIARLRSDLADNAPDGTIIFNQSAMNFQMKSGSTWHALDNNAGKYAFNVDKLDGFHANAGVIANSIVVRDSKGVIPGNISGRAPVATEADELTTINPISKGGTGAATSAQARANLGTNDIGNLTIGVLPFERGGTGAATSAQARANLGAPPTSHASSQNTYGVGDASSYGHVKLSDTLGTQGVSEGTSATPKLVNDTKTTIDASISSLSASLDSTDASLTAHVEDKNDPHETLPAGGTIGQVLTVTDSGEAWSDLPDVDLTGKADNDLSNVTAPTQAFKNMSVGWGIPDYSAGVTLSNNTSYTAIFDGFVVLVCSGSANQKSYPVKVTLNSTVLMYVSIYGWVGASGVGRELTFPVSKGDVIELNTTATINKYSIYPFKGSTTYA